MKRSFGISVKRSKNYQSVECNESFEDEFSDNELFEQEKQKLVERVHKQVEKELENLEHNFKLEVD